MSFNRVKFANQKNTNALVSQIYKKCVFQKCMIVFSVKNKPNTQEYVWIAKYQCKIYVKNAKISKQFMEIAIIALKKNYAKNAIKI